MAVRDPRRDVVVGRDPELARAREAVRTRREHSQTLFITGPAGIGKTALAEAALAGLDAEVLYLRGSPLDRHGPYETAINNIATFEQSERFEPIRERIAEIVAAGGRELPSGRDTARALIAVIRTIPERDRAAVVVFENLHLFDEYSLQATRVFARQNHLYDQPYLILGRSGHPYPDFEGLPHIRLGPLADEAARAALGHWSELVVPTVVAEALNAACDGNPLILREVAASLTPAQLRGDIALPAPLPWLPAIDECLSEVLDALTEAELAVLAAFSLARALPAAVVRTALPDGAIDSLVERGLLSVSSREVRLDQAALGWTAWHRLGAEQRERVARGLARAWPSVDPLTGTWYRVLQAPITFDALTRAREVLNATTTGRARPSCEQPWPSWSSAARPSSTRGRACDGSTRAWRSSTWRRPSRRGRWWPRPARVAIIYWSCFDVARCSPA